MPPRIKIQPGDKYGRLTVVQESLNKGKLVWECICECGNTRYVRPFSLNDPNGTRSCGCIRIEMFINRNTKHNKCDHPLYGVWEAMKGRCYNANNKKYKNYGARGIKVCKRWHIFNNFYNDVKGGYLKGLTLDRPNVNGDYKPSNYRWVTQKIQGRNKTNNRLITYNGVTKSLSEWCEEYNINRSTLNKRLNNGWNINESIFKSPIKK